MIAEFESRCGLCDGIIVEGDEIELYEDEWVHSSCVEDE